MQYIQSSLNKNYLTLLSLNAATIISSVGKQKPKSLLQIGEFLRKKLKPTCPDYVGGMLYSWNAVRSWTLCSYNLVSYVNPLNPHQHHPL